MRFKLALCIICLGGLTIPFCSNERVRSSLLSGRRMLAEGGVNLSEDRWVVRYALKQINAAEEYYGLPKNILRAVAIIESNLSPFVIRVGVRVYRFPNLDEAKQFLRGLRYTDPRQIDVGCMQINLQHLRHFSNIEEMIDPYKNIWFAAKLLAYNVTRTRSISRSIMFYNTSNPRIGYKYYEKVIYHWGKMGGRKENIDIFSYQVRKQYSLGSAISEVYRKIRIRRVGVPFVT